jgi:hypothetical protein
MNNQTAMRQLLNQLRDERDALPMDAEWNRCFQAIESVIESKYIPIERNQIIAANEDSSTNELGELFTGEQYYNETYGQ